ncbi:MAG: hypothetical protein IBX69_16245, partial [Anaerolineales bacterium]|nr:hypothetical protein [Anaerolineales bacterium]
WTTRGFLVGLAGHALLEVVVRAFYAQQNARTPLFTAALATGSYIPLAIIFARYLGVPGIALANAVVITGQTLLLLYILNKKFAGLWQVRDTLLRVVAVSAVSAAIVYGLLRVPLPIHPLPISIMAMGIGGVLVLPFILKEIRMLIKL